MLVGIIWSLAMILFLLCAIPTGRRADRPALHPGSEVALVVVVLIALELAGLL